jgi:hypothetical protein
MDDTPSTPRSTLAARYLLVQQVCRPAHREYGETIDEAAEASLNSSHPCKPVSDFDQPSAEFRVSYRASNCKTTRRLAKCEQIFDEGLAVGIFPL